MGKAAREFIQFLKEAKQTCWQILPLNPTSYGDSPYQSFSSFAGNPYLIDLDDLQAEGLLEQKDYKDLNWGSNPEQVDYGLLYQNRFSVLKKAVEKLPQVYGEQFQTFCTEQVEWLDNYALFMALKDAFGGVAWSEWTEELRCREPQAVEQAQKQYADQITFWKGVQFLFFHLWVHFSVPQGIVKSQSDVILLAGFGHSLNHIGRIAGAGHIIFRIFAVPQAETVVMLGNENHIFHAGVFCTFDPLFRVNSRWIIR